jgi:hypothetical protein
MNNEEDLNEKTETKDTDAAARQPWRKPHFARIEIKRTMIGSGSPVDGSAGSS